jgi:uncharacterized membrane protein YdcZ (DUF606 family)
MNALLARVRRRIVYASLAAFMAGTMALMWAWFGLPTKVQPVALARPFSEAWWYFPAYAAIGFVLVLLMPKSFDRDLGL